jgi:hypothetical protein
MRAEKARDRVRTTTQAIVWRMSTPSPWWAGVLGGPAGDVVRPECWRLASKGLRGATIGCPDVLRCREPSNFFATSVR